MLQNEKRLHPHICVTSLRMAGITGGKLGLVPVDLVTKFVEKALRGDPLEIMGRHQFERLDVRDAVEGIVRFLAIPQSSWKEVYNLGQGSAFSIEDLASEVVEQVSQVKGTEPVKIIENIVDDELNFGMDSSEFFHVTGWKPQFTIKDTIHSLITYLENE